MPPKRSKRSGEVSGVQGSQSTTAMLNQQLIQDQKNHLMMAVSVIGPAGNPDHQSGQMEALDTNVSDFDEKSMSVCK